MKKIIISEQIPNSLKSMLLGIGFLPVLLPCHPSLPTPTASHADMLIFSDGEYRLIQKQYYNDNKEVFGDIPFCFTDEMMANKYPKDILLNALLVKDTLIGKQEYISIQLRERYEKRINVKQGYSRCSVLLLKNGAITADKGLYRTLSNITDVLLINEGNILLPGYDFGFIGGASAVTEGTVLFFGDITAHPDYQKISDFCHARDYDIIYDKTTPLTDYGGAIILG